MLTIGNNGKEIKETNFWQTQLAKEGGFFLSVNAGAARLLVPKTGAGLLIPALSSEYVVITSGVFKNNGRPGIEIMFEDNSDSPFVLFIGREQCDRGFLKSESDKPFEFTIWVEECGKPRLLFGKTAFSRTGGKLPCMKAYPGYAIYPNPHGQQEYAQDKTFQEKMIEKFFSSIKHALLPLKYEKPLPADLSPWHCCVVDSGHCIMAVPKGLSEKTDNNFGLSIDRLSFVNAPLEKRMVPVPVKYVLRKGWEVNDGFVIVNGLLQPEYGLFVDEVDDDYEYI